MVFTEYLLGSRCFHNVCNWAALRTSHSVFTFSMGYTVPSIHHLTSGNAILYPPLTVKLTRLYCSYLLSALVSEFLMADTCLTYLCIASAWHRNSCKGACSVTTLRGLWGKITVSLAVWSGPQVEGKLGDRKRKVWRGRR